LVQERITQRPGRQLAGQYPAYQFGRPNHFADSVAGERFKPRALQNIAATRARNFA
jgi:hypothetical protein